MRKIASSFLCCVLFTLLSATVYAQAPTISNVSPIRVTERSTITVTGTNFTGTLVVKVGATLVTPITTTATSMTFRTLGSGVVTIAKSGQPTATSIESITYVAPLATTSSAAVTRFTSDYNNTYWISSTATGAIVPNNNSNITSFTYGGTVYSTGVKETQISANNPIFTPGVFKAFAIGNLPGNTGAPSNYLVFSKAIDGDPNSAVVTSPAVAGKKVKDVLTDGINGLNIATGLTNAAEVMQLEFAVSHIDVNKIADGIPDIMIPQIADVNSSKFDYYVFTDISGNIVGSYRQNNFSAISDIAAYSVDFFTLTNPGTYNTAVATISASTTTNTRPIRGAAFQLSDFGINAGNYASIAYFKVLTGGDMDPAFYSYNANSIITLPYITAQPQSQTVCTGNAVNVTFTVAANSTDAVSYQWKKNGVDIPGATFASYTINNAGSGDVAAYTVVLTNLAGSVTSDAANLNSLITTTAIWTGATSTDWNVTSNWTCNTLPSATINASIPAGAANYPILSSSTGTAKDLTIAANATVTVSGTGILQIAGTVSNSGTLNAVDGTVAFIGTTGAQVIPANVFQTHVIKNLTTNNTAGVTLSSATDLTGTLTVTVGAFNTGGFLTLKSNAATTAMIAAVGGSISGNMTIERYIPAKRAFRFISSPTTGGTIHQNWQENAVLPDSVGFGTDITGLGGTANGFDTSGSNNPSMYTYLNDNPGTTTSWIPVTSTNDPLVAGTPYRILVRGDRAVNQASNNAPATNTTLRTTGSVLTGDHVVTGLNPDAGGFSLIGNAYQAPVDMNALLTDASALLNKNFFYVWDPTRNDRGAYVTVILPQGGNTFTGSVADKYLQPGQACFIQTATAGSPTLTFRESYKHQSTATTSVWKTEENSAQMRVTLYDSAATSGVGADGMLIQFGDYSNALDTFDAVKPGNQDENMGTINTAKVLSFESRSMPVAEDIIPISVTQYRKTSYVYKVDVNGLAGVNAVLLDKYTNTRTPLTNDAQTQIPFTVDSAVAESVAANRFDIVFENVLAVADNAFANAVQIYPNPATDNFFIKLPSTEKEINVKLTNALGQNIYSETVISQNGLAKIQPKTALQSGIYMVSISNGKSTTTQKLIIK